MFLDAVPASPELTEQAMLQIRGVLRTLRRLPSNRADDFEVFHTGREAQRGCPIQGNRGCAK